MRKDRVRLMTRTSDADKDGADSRQEVCRPESAVGRQPGQLFERFVSTIAHLRSDDGCPWDRAQTHQSIARNLVEESYEAVDAIEQDDPDSLREELGDVLLQVVLQSQMASESGHFDIKDVIGDVNDKMIRRHPHVFGDDAAFAAAHLAPEQIAQVKATASPTEVLELWDQIKLLEKQGKLKRGGQSLGAFPAGEPAAPGDGQPERLSDEQPEQPGDEQSAAPGDGCESLGLLTGIPLSLPALMQAQDISRKAVSVGFEWADLASVWEQVASEIDEYRAEDQGSERAAEEFGDLLFSLVNVARKEGIDAESALRSSCRKFRDRWAIMEHDAQMAQRPLSDYSVDELEGLWDKAKRELSSRR